jgi:predicted nucleic acid-binding protein
MARDSLYWKAVSRWKDLAGETLLTSNHVLDETITLLSRRNQPPNF